MREKLLEVICAVCGAEADEMEWDLELFESGLLDSFGAMELLVRLENAFGIRLKVETIPREKIATPEKLLRLLEEAKP